MDHFKKHLQQHLEKMDTDIPGEAVWCNIQKEIIPVVRKHNPVKRIYQYAAAACALLCIAAGIRFWVRKQQIIQPATITAIDSFSKPATIVNIQPQTVPIAPNKQTQETIPPASRTPVIYTRDYTKTTAPKQHTRTKKTLIPDDPSLMIVNEVEQNYAQLVNSQLVQLRATPVYAESPGYFSTFKRQLQQIEADEATIKKDIRQHGLTEELLQQLISMAQHKLQVLKDLRTEIKKLNTHQAKSATDSSQSFYLNM